MKLLKIGSSSSSNIVLNSEFVSSHHAEILLLDSGEIILEDKNSTNGQYAYFPFSVSNSSRTTIGIAKIINPINNELIA